MYVILIDLMVVPRAIIVDTTHTQKFQTDGMGAGKACCCETAPPLGGGD